VNESEVTQNNILKEKDEQRERGREGRRQTIRNLYQRAVAG
jgi:hypothetical protein